MSRLARTFLLSLASLFGALFLTTSAAAQTLPMSITGFWNASWITHPDIAAEETAVLHFQRDLVLEVVPESFVVRVSADNRYRLFVNGASVSVGPARSDLMHWRYERVDLAPFLRAGSNLIAATVWNWGDSMPTAQISLRTGFLLEGEESDAINTGESWQVVQDNAYGFTMPEHEAIGGYYVAAPGEDFDGNVHPWGWDDRDGGSARESVAWTPAVTIGAFPGLSRGSAPHGTAGEWQLVESQLPPMEETHERFAAIRRTSGVEAEPELLTGMQDLVIPANTQAAVLLDRGRLTNAYPVLLASGGTGANMRLTYAESLYDADGNKGDRNAIEGKTIKGVSDTIAFDGGDRRRFQPLWWRTYRYVQLDIETGEDPLALHDIHGVFTAYPMQQNAAFSSDQDWIGPIWDINWRGLRLSAYDTFMDTPYWEQLQYVGDTRIEALVTLYNSGDDRLVRNALTLINQSRMPDGLTTSRYPTDETQIIPPFSLWWSAMVHDYWMHRDDPEFVRSFMPGVRGVMAWYEGQIDETGLLGPMPWWNFLDWAPKFPIGMAPGSRDGHSATLTLQFAYTLRRVAELEERFGQPAEAARFHALADQLGEAVREQAWDEERGLFADTPAKTSFSQHANVLAVLAGVVPANEQKALMERVLADDSLIQATVYFRFYVDEAMMQAGLGDRYLERLDLWQEMIRIGLTTTPESPEPTRSDSHAWATHPNYHLLASVLGVRPASEGFGTISIAPMLGEMQHASGTIPHPSGPISVTLRRAGSNGLDGEIELPPGLHGTFDWDGEVSALSPGTNTIALAGQ